LVVDVHYCIIVIQQTSWHVRNDERVALFDYNQMLTPRQLY